MFIALCCAPLERPEKNRKPVTINIARPNGAQRVSTKQIFKSAIKVQAYKYDGVLHRSWDAELLRQEGSLVVLDAEFPEEIVHDLLGTIATGTRSLEYYWLDRWYNVFRFAQPDGTLRNYYCNVNVPATFDGKTLSYVDLDLDILVDPDFSYQVLDVADFEKNAALFSYTAEVQTKAREALAELVGLIEQRAFPFSEA
jgi:protein associated with RNAse G/E